MAARNLGSTTLPSPSPADAAVASAFLEHRRRRACAKRRRARFHTLEVAEVRPLTADAVEVTFTVPEELADDYNYLPGQYVALRTSSTATSCGAATRSAGRPSAAASRSRSSATWAGVLDVGELRAEGRATRLDVMSPQGTFTSTLDALDGKHVVGIAAGSRHHTAHGARPHGARALRRQPLRPRLHEPLDARRDVPRGARRPEGPVPAAARPAPRAVARAAHRAAALRAASTPRSCEHDARRAHPPRDGRRVVPVRTVRARAARAATRSRRHGVPASTCATSCSRPDADRVEPRHGRPVVVERGEPTVTIKFTLDGQSSTSRARRARTSRS